MEFQITEILTAVDPETVLETLEPHLRAIAGIVDRFEGQIMAVGIGESPIVFRWSDVTTVDVSAEIDRTIVTVHVTYQPVEHRYKAEGARTVRERIESALEQTLAELHVERLQPIPIPIPTPNTAGASKAAQPEKQAETPVLQVANGTGRVDREARGDAALSNRAATPVRETPSEVREPRVVVMQPPEPAPPQAPQRAAAPARARTTSLHAVNSGASTPPLKPDPPPPRRRWLMIVASVLLTVVLGADWWMMTHRRSSSRQATAGDLQHNAAHGGTPAAPASAPAAQPALAVKPEEDLKQWAEDWAAALRSRDAEAQASYYSDNVDNYLGHASVTRQFIQQDKTAQLQSREHLATLKIEHVQVVFQTNTRAVLVVIKHTIVQDPGAGVSESFVRSRLKLKKLGGVWQIVEERDLSPEDSSGPRIG